MNVPGWLNRLMAVPDDVTHGDVEGKDDESAEPDDELAARLRGVLRPVPIERGEVIAFPSKSVQQEFPYRPGAALPTRGGRHSDARGAAPVPQPAQSLPVAWEPEETPFPAWLREPPGEPAAPAAPVTPLAPVPPPAPVTPPAAAATRTAPRKRRPEPEPVDAPTVRVPPPARRTTSRRATAGPAPARPAAVRSVAAEPLEGRLVAASEPVAHPAPAPQPVPVVRSVSVAQAVTVPESGVPVAPAPSSSQEIELRKDHSMGNIEVILKDAMQIDGAIGVALVDFESGMTLGQSGGSMFNLEVAAAGNTDVVRAKMRTLEALGLSDSIQDILITLDSQYHLIRLMTSRSANGLFLYLALHKNQSNLAMARHQLANLERRLEL